MHCASCATNIQKTIQKLDGVEKADIHYATEKAKIAYDSNRVSAADFTEALKPLGYTISPSENHDHNQGAKPDELSAMRTQIFVISPIVLFSIAVMTAEILGKYGVIAEMPKSVYDFMHHLMPLFATYMLFVVGKPYLLGLYRFFRYGKANMDTLIGLGTSVAFLYSFFVSALESTIAPYIDVTYSYYDITIVVIGFITLGKYLEMRAKQKTGDAITQLLGLQAKTALVRRNGEEKEIPIQDVIHGDEIIVKPGMRIPVDGVILEGSSFIDESMITGESIPVEKTIGKRVIGGTLNTTGSFVFTAKKVGSETLLAHIIKLVEDAQSSRAPIQALADKISAIFVPIVLVISIISFILWLIFATPAFGLSTAITYAITAFVSVLIIACPCALGLATPTAIIVGVGKGAKAGILIKDAETLEKLHSANTLVLDKTGTITNGKPVLVNQINQSSLSDDELLGVLASLEAKSEHPIAQAILEKAKSIKLSIPTNTDFEIVKGKGLKAKIGEAFFYAGNTAYMHDRGIALDESMIKTETSKGYTPIFLASEKELLGMYFVADTIKPEAQQAIANLQQIGMRMVMLTGDNKHTAEFIAKTAGITEVIAEVLPQDKLAIVKELQESGAVVAMVGDGINDAPALAQADIGIAMSTGSDIAIDTAGITILHGDLSKIVKAIHLSAITMRGIKQNLFWAFIYNVVGIPLAAGLFFPIFGWLLNPIFAGFAMAFSSVSVVGNSLRLKQKKL